MAGPDPLSNDVHAPPAHGRAPGPTTAQAPVGEQATVQFNHPAGGPVPSQQTPRLFGNYELLKELGRGGMGVVYKARQRGLNRLVALKMILAGEYAGAHELARFSSEAQAVARLQHPHIVQVFEVGEHEGHPYFSLEFCPEGSLDHKLRGNPLPAREAAHLMEVLARAMHAAHRADVVHRDLKPANILLVRTDPGDGFRLAGGDPLPAA